MAAELAGKGRKPGATVNPPVPRHDARAPVVVAIGLAGVAALAWWARGRRRQPAADADRPNQVPPSRAVAPALLLAGAGTAALVVRRVGVTRLIRYAPLIRAGIRWLADPHPLLPGGRAGGLRLSDLARPLLPGGGRERARFVAGLLLGGSAAFPIARLTAPGRGRSSDPHGDVGDVDERARIVGARRQLGIAAALLGLAVLADSGLEHYRACFHNRAMYTPLVSASLTILANLHAAAGSDGAPSVARDAVHLASGAVGIVGLGFHLYNIGKRPGGYDWLNFFYGAPFGAPAALTLAALIGFAAERLDAGKPAAEQRLVGLPFAPAMAAVTGIGLAGTVAEVTLLHFRGAFHNPFMWLPVSLPPVAAMLMAKQAVAPSGADAWVTRGWLWMTAVLGIGGVGFHAYGVSRNMGGWSNWSQNILAGPPLPAPPSFAALAIAGLAVLDLGGEGR